MFQNLLINTKNLISIRKYQKLKQVDVADKLDISLRKYTTYENNSAEVRLSSLDLTKLAIAIKTSPFQLLAELPTNITCHWRNLNSVSNFAEFILSGRYELHVSGSPSKKELREPLLEIVATFEKSKAQVKEGLALSESLKQRFTCEDLLHELVGILDQDEAWNGEAALLGMVVPGLYIREDWLPSGGDEMVQSDIYTWTNKTELLIDFSKSLKDQPVSYNLIYGNQVWLDSFGRNKENAPEVYEKMVKEALDARPEIPIFDDDDHTFLTEPFMISGPVVDEAQLTVKEAPGAEVNTAVK